MSYMSGILVNVCVYALVLWHCVAVDVTENVNLTTRRVLNTQCDTSAPKNSRYTAYFEDMSKIYHGQDDGTCLPLHQKCGWPRETFAGKKLPLYVLVVGLEGSGHHFWTKLLNDPLFQCNWVGIIPPLNAKCNCPFFMIHSGECSSLSS